MWSTQNNVQNILRSKGSLRHPINNFDELNKFWDTEVFVLNFNFASDKMITDNTCLLRCVVTHNFELVM